MARTSFYPIWHIWKSLKTENNPTFGLSRVFPLSISLKIWLPGRNSSRFSFSSRFLTGSSIVGVSSSQCPFVPEGGRGQIFLYCPLLHSIWTISITEGFPLQALNVEMPDPKRPYFHILSPETTLPQLAHFCQSTEPQKFRILFTGSVSMEVHFLKLFAEYFSKNPSFGVFSPVLPSQDKDHFSPHSSLSSWPHPKPLPAIRIE